MDNESNNDRSKKQPFEVLNERRIQALNDGNYAKWVFLSNELGFGDFTSPNDPRLKEGELELSQNNSLRKLRAEVDAVYGLFNKPKKSELSSGANKQKSTQDISDIISQPSQDNSSTLKNKEVMLTKEGYPYQSFDFAARMYVEKDNQLRGVNSNSFNKSQAYNLAIKPYMQKMEDILKNVSISIKNPTPQMPNHITHFEKEYGVEVISRDAFEGTNKAYLHSVQDFIESFATSKIKDALNYVSSRRKK